MPRRLRSPLLLVLLGLVYFYDLVLHPTAILYADHSDFLTAHIPDKTFLVQAVHETGELPLWCPYKFGGSPFIHDIQLGAFYPPHLVLYLLPAERVGNGLSWLIVAHVILAGLLMYAYAGRQGLSEPARLVAAVGYMFAGRWLLHVLAGGHYILVGLAWLPLLLLLYESAIRQRSLVRATAAGGVQGLLVLGTQPQWTFYAGLFVGLWALGVAWESSASGSRADRLRALAAWLGFGVWMVAVALGLAAVQLLPTLEAVGLSTRGGGIDHSEVLGGGARTFLFLVGPALATDPANLEWEDRGGLCLLWLTAAVLAGVSLRGRVRFQAAVTLILVLFALGGAYLVQGLPGFRLFRSPNRMFVILGFPLALLAGQATDALFGGTAEDRWQRCRAIFVRLTLALVILAGGFSLRMVIWEGKMPRLQPYWFSLLVTVPAMFVLLRQRHPWIVRHGLALWMALLLVDSWALTMPLVDTRNQADVFAPSPSVVQLAAYPPGQGRALDRDGLTNPYGSPLGHGVPLALLNRVEAVRGYTPLDSRRYKEYLQFIAGDDEPLTAFSSPLTFPVINDFPIVNKPLLDLLGVRYLLAPTGEPDDTAANGWDLVFHDPNPRVYDMDQGGVRALPPYSLYQNRNVLPRAFIVHQAAPLPPQPDVLARLTATDFAKEVLLENGGDLPPPPSGETGTRSARIAEYLPNGVTVAVDDGAAGYLVLADPWYPGWVARVDGAPEPQAVYRADYLFRAVRVGEGRHTIVFSFEPESYANGRRVSLATAGVAGFVLLLGLGRAAWQKWRR